MDTTRFQQYRNVIAQLPEDCLQDNPRTKVFDHRLRLAWDGNLSIYYAPFEYLNDRAKVVIVGLTPGYTQMVYALREAKQQLRTGADDRQVLQRAKRAAGFGGNLRGRLIEMLDHVNLHRWLGISSTADLFAEQAHLLQTASVLSFPVFVGNENYSGKPNLLKHPLLHRYLLDHFGMVVERLPNAVYVPVGDEPTTALQYLAANGRLDPRHIIEGLPHPSGANNERIDYFLGRKPKERLSSRTNAGKIDQAKERIGNAITALPPLSMTEA